MTLDISEALYILRAFETTHVATSFDARDLQELKKAVIRGLDTLPRPIAEAPKDGKPVLGFTKFGCLGLVWNYSDKWRTDKLSFVEATYFIPLSALEKPE